MKLLPRKLLLSGAGCALAAAATLSLPACTDTGYYSGSSNQSSSSFQRLGGRYYHCHRNNGVCHSARHPNYYWSGGQYRPRPEPYSSTPDYYYRPALPPKRPRPL